MPAGHVGGSTEGASECWLTLPLILFAIETQSAMILAGTLPNQPSAGSSMWPLQRCQSRAIEHHTGNKTILGSLPRRSHWKRMCDLLVPETSPSWLLSLLAYWQLYLHSPLSGSPTAPTRWTTVCELHRQQVTLKRIRSNVLSIDTITAVSVTHAIPRIDGQEWYFAALAGRKPCAKVGWSRCGMR
jgi:hypothetical protein